MAGQRAISIACLIIAAGYVADAVIAHTSFTFVPGEPKSAIRSVLFAVWAFWNVSFAFAVLYALAGPALKPPPGYPKALYSSIVTVATLGDSTTVPDAWPAYLLVSAQLVIGLYFIAVIFAAAIVGGIKR